MPTVEDFKKKWRVVKATRRNGDVYYYLKRRYFWGLFWKTHQVMTGVDYYETVTFDTEEKANEYIDSQSKHYHSQYMHEVTRVERR